MTTTIEKQTDFGLDAIMEAKQRIKSVVQKTPLQFSERLSEKYEADVYLKREDMQVVRSYKLRGAFNKIAQIAKKNTEVVCSSAGNHAQGVAFSCAHLNVKGTIYMPNTTPQQKIESVKRFGKKLVDVKIVGDTYDDAYAAAKNYETSQGAIFIHPFNDPAVIQGQGTVGLEILDDLHAPIDYLFVPVGGGGLSSGIVKVFSSLSPKTKIIGVEPLGAPAMKKSLALNKIVILDEIDSFVDGAVVKQVGELTFDILKDKLHDIILAPEGKICSTILELYNEDAIVAEPAGAMSISALDLEGYREKIIGKKVICIISGGNNDIARMEEMKERSLIYENLKHYFLVSFPQRAGALSDFLNHVLGPNDDITYFQYSKKINREKGPAVIGIELKSTDDLAPLLHKMNTFRYDYKHLNKDEKELFRVLV